jgi:hypothetical protein
MLHSLVNGGVGTGNCTYVCKSLSWLAMAPTTVAMLENSTYSVRRAISLFSSRRAGGRRPLVAICVCVLQVVDGVRSER